MHETTRNSYLKAMGVQVYRLREVPTETSSAEEEVSEQPISADAVEPVNTTSADTVPSGDDLMSYMAMDQSIPESDPEDEVLEFPLKEKPAMPGVESLDWDGLQQYVANCERCELCRTRTNTVFGVGNPDADVMIIGEAPGADEDAKGEPFVGRAGQLLDNMLKAIGLDRQQVFIANILKCRPPDNRNPSFEEVTACEGYLNRQIDLIQPKIILSVGGVSAKNLLKTEEAVGRLRLQQHQLVNRKLPVLVTYHPAYLLRKPSEKAKSWEDLKKLKQVMSQ
jgi:DNA polymerase